MRKHIYIFLFILLISFTNLSCCPPISETSENKDTKDTTTTINEINTTTTILDEKEDWRESVLEYQNNVDRISQSASEAVGRITAFSTAFSYSTDEDKDKMDKDIVIVEQSYQDSKTLKPPEKMEDIHEHFLKGMKFYFEAMGPFSKGIDSNDEKLINQSGDLLLKGREELKMAAQKQVEFNENFGF